MWAQSQELMYSRREGGLGWREISGRGWGQSQPHCSLLWMCHICQGDKMYYGLGALQMERNIHGSCLFDFFPFFSFLFFLFCTTLSNLGIMELFYAFCTIIRLWMAAQRPLATEEDGCKKMQKIGMGKKKKKGTSNNLPLNLKGTKWGTSGQFILLFTDNKSLCFYVLSLVFHNLFERRWEIM